VTAMRFRIHRGAAEIGGNCIEVESRGKSLLLDLGLPLDAAEPDSDLLPPVAGLTDGDNPNLLGVILSHPHGDHYRLLESAHPSVLVYMGQGSRRLLDAAAPFMAAKGFSQPVTTYNNRQTFTVGPFRITPYLMDHSAFDAYALLVEADGRRLLYSGDFRAHGRKAWAFDAFLSHPPCRVDALLMEGTALGRNNSPEPETEAQLEMRIAASISDTRGLVLACFSAQNIDRFVTFYKATLRAGRMLAIDAYTASILDALALPSLPLATSPSSGIRVFLPKRQKMRIVRTRRFDLVEPYSRCRIYPSDIVARPEQWVMMFRTSMIEDAESIGTLAGGRLIWSLWPGYLDRQKPDLRAWSEDHGISFEIRHTSGHAHVSDMMRFVDGVGPRMVIPIHTQHPDRYAALFPNVVVCDDGQWLDLQ
jgi:ribonuclease J